MLVYDSRGLELITVGITWQQGTGMLAGTGEARSIKAQRAKLGFNQRRESVASFAGAGAGAIWGIAMENE